MSKLDSSSKYLPGLSPAPHLNIKIRFRISSLGSSAPRGPAQCAARRDTGPAGRAAETEI